MTISHEVDANLSPNPAMTCHTSSIADGRGSIVSMRDDRGEFARETARAQNMELNGPDGMEAGQKSRFMPANSVCDMLTGACVSIHYSGTYSVG